MHLVHNSKQPRGTLDQTSNLKPQSSLPETSRVNPLQSLHPLQSLQSYRTHQQNDVHLIQNDVHRIHLSKKGCILQPGHGKMRLELLEDPSRSHVQIHPPYCNKRTFLSAHPITFQHTLGPFFQHTLLPPHPLSFQTVHLTSLALTLCTAPPHTWRWCVVAAGARRQKTRWVKGCAVSKEWKSES